MPVGGHHGLPNAGQSIARGASVILSRESQKSFGLRAGWTIGLNFSLTRKVRPDRWLVGSADQAGWSPAHTKWSTTDGRGVPAGRPPSRPEASPNSAPAPHFRRRVYTGKLSQRRPDWAAAERDSTEAALQCCTGRHALPRLHRGWVAQSQSSQGCRPLAAHLAALRCPGDTCSCRARRGSAAATVQPRLQCSAAKRSRPRGRGFASWRRPPVWAGFHQRPRRQPAPAVRILFSPGCTYCPLC